MGLLDNILGGLPENALLRQKNGDLETKNASLDQEVAILKDQLREANGKVAKLEKRIEQLTHIELDETKIKILETLPHLDYRYAEVIAKLLGTNETRIEYHLDLLKQAGYVIGYQSTLGLPDSFELTPKGKAYLVENNLDFNL